MSGNLLPGLSDAAALAAPTTTASPKPRSDANASATGVEDFERALKRASSQTETKPVGPRNGEKDQQSAGSDGGGETTGGEPADNRAPSRAGGAEGEHARRVGDGPSAEADLAALQAKQVLTEPREVAVEIRTDSASGSGPTVTKTIERSAGAASEQLVEPESETSDLPIAGATPARIEPDGALGPIADGEDATATLRSSADGPEAGAGRAKTDSEPTVTAEGSETAEPSAPQLDATRGSTERTPAQPEQGVKQPAPETARAAQPVTTGTSDGATATAGDVPTDVPATPTEAAASAPDPSVVSAATNGVAVTEERQSSPRSSTHPSATDARSPLRSTTRTGATDARSPQPTTPDTLVSPTSGPTEGTVLDRLVEPSVLPETAQPAPAGEPGLAPAVIGVEPTAPGAVPLGAEIAPNTSAGNTATVMTATPVTEQIQPNELGPAAAEASPQAETEGSDPGDPVWRQVRRALGSLRTNSSGEQQMTIRLRPDAMGSVVVRVTTGEAGTAIALVADSAAAATQLQQQRQLLVSELASSGMPAVAVDIGAEQQGDQRQAAAFDAESSGEGSGSNRDPSGSSRSDDADADVAPNYRDRRFRTPSAGLVDLDL